MSFLSTVTKTTLAGAVATFMTVSAHAAVIVQAILDPNPTSTSLFSNGLYDLGSGGTVNPATGKVTSITSGFTLPGGPTVTFTGQSGVYTGDVAGSTRSPFRTAGDAATGTNYFNAQAGSGGGSITFTYGTAQTSFMLLWGSVDDNPTNRNNLVFTFSGGGASQTVTGADAYAAAGGASGGVVSGISNLAVLISGLNAFTSVTVTDASNSNAFEFMLARPGVLVPEPASLAILGAGLLGLGLARRRAARA